MLPHNYKYMLRIMRGQKYKPVTNQVMGWGRKLKESD